MWELIRQLSSGIYQRGMAPFNASATAPIPGLTGPLGSGAGIPRTTPIAPSQQPPNLPSAPAWQYVMNSGPYGQQAAQLAGLLGTQPTMQIPTQPTQPRAVMGMLGAAPSMQSPQVNSQGLNAAQIERRNYRRPSGTFTNVG